MIQPNVFVALLSLVGAVFSTWVVNHYLHRIVQEVNEHLPEQARFAQVWWHSRHKEIYAQHKTLYPDSRHLSDMRIFESLAVVFLMSLAWSSGVLPVPQYF